MEPRHPTAELCTQPVVFFYFCVENWPLSTVQEVQGDHLHPDLLGINSSTIHPSNAGASVAAFLSAPGSLELRLAVLGNNVVP